MAARVWIYIRGKGVPIIDGHTKKVTIYRLLVLMYCTKEDILYHSSGLVKVFASKAVKTM